MSTTVSPTSVNAPTQKTSTSSFDDQLNIAKSSQVLVDYLKQQGKSAINADELAQLANNSSGSVPAEVSAAASYMTRHTSVYTAIEIMMSRVKMAFLASGISSGRQTVASKAHR